jgi:SAM-dependent methyltransferase
MFLPDIIYIIIALFLVLSALGWRMRIIKCAVVPAGSAPASADHLFITTEGVLLSDSVKLGASHYALEHNLDMLDLIPADLPAEEVLSLIQMYDPRAYRTKRIGRALSAGQAMLLAKNNALRAGISTDTAVDQKSFCKLSQHVKKFASGRADLAIMPSLHATAHQGLFCYPERTGFNFGNFSAAVFLLYFAITAFILLGLAIAPAAALAALLALHAQPVIALTGTPLRPRNLFAVSALRSLILLATSLPGILAHIRRAKVNADAEKARTVYTDLMSGGLERFFEPRRSTCPLCGGDSLQSLVATPEFVVHKPGWFVLEQCGSCKYIFQNPRLNTDGLSFYYRDLYDGLGTQMTEIILGSSDQIYKKRAGLFSRYCKPSRWLDVGAGNGYFCCVAKGILPDTCFDGLDISQGVVHAQEQGWVEHGFKQHFTELAETFPSRYDVISMIQYLEHTPEPAAQLQAAHKVLSENGTLFIEIPNPDFLPGRILGRYWFQWLQPQHLYFFSAGNMELLLKKNGFTPVAFHFSEVHVPIDFVTAAVLFLRDLVPSQKFPWVQKKFLGYTVWRALVLISVSPLVLAGLLVDMLLLPFAKMGAFSNNYTVVARQTPPEV